MFISNNKNEKKRNNFANGKEYNSFYLQNP